MERKEILVIALIGLLLVTAGLQTMQLAGLTKASVIVSSGGSIPSVSQQATTGAPSVPPNLQNLPSMVGGC